MVGFVEKKDGKESFDAMYRRFTRNVISSQTLAIAKGGKFFEKEPNQRAKKEAALAKQKILAAKKASLY